MKYCIAPRPLERWLFHFQRNGPRRSDGNIKLDSIETTEIYVQSGMTSCHTNLPISLANVIFTQGIPRRPISPPHPSTEPRHTLPSLRNIALATSGSFLLLSDIGRSKWLLYGSGGRAQSEILFHSQWKCPPSGGYDEYVCSGCGDL